MTIEGSLAAPTSTLDYTGLRPDQLRQQLIKAQSEGVDIQQEASLQGAIQHLLSEFQSRSGAYEPNSLKMLNFTWGKFVSWCIENQQVSLPATPETVENFFTFSANRLHRNTLSVYRWGISRMHLISGCPDPCDDIYVKNTLKAIKKEKVRSGEVIKQASPLRECHLDKLEEMWGGSTSLKEIRDLTLISVAYESMLREAEIANIHLDHLEFLGDGCAILTIPITKTNHSGIPDTCLISARVVSLIRDYAVKSGFSLSDGGYLFRGVSRFNKGIKGKIDLKNQTVIHKPITPRTVANSFHSAWVALNLEAEGVSKFTGHSARVGATQDLLADGYSSVQVEQSGRWSTGVMVSRYGRAILASQTAMADRRRPS